VVENYTNGIRKGVQYFKPQPGRGKFMQLAQLKPDQRFVDVSPPNSSAPVPKLTDVVMQSTCKAYVYMAMCAGSAGDLSALYLVYCPAVTLHLLMKLLIKGQGTCVVHSTKKGMNTCEQDKCHAPLVSNNVRFEQYCKLL